MVNLLSGPSYCNDEKISYRSFNYLTKTDNKIKAAHFKSKRDKFSPINGVTGYFQRGRKHSSNGILLLHISTVYLGEEIPVYIL